MSKGLWFETFSTLAVRDNKMSNVRWIFYYVLNFLIWWVRLKKYICKPIPFTIDFMSSIRCELNLILNYECEMTFWFFLYKAHVLFTTCSLYQNEILLMCKIKEIFKIISSHIQLCCNGIYAITWKNNDVLYPIKIPLILYFPCN